METKVFTKFKALRSSYLGTCSVQHSVSPVLQRAQLPRLLRHCKRGKNRKINPRPISIQRVTKGIVVMFVAVICCYCCCSLYPLSPPSFEDRKEVVCIAFKVMFGLNKVHLSRTNNILSS
jgi:hypothetical protein